MELEIQKIKNADELIIKLGGRLDTITSPELKKEVENLEGVKRLVLDFENLDYISSAGLRVLMIAQGTMQEQGKMVIRNVKSKIKKILDMTGFDKILTIE